MNILRLKYFLLALILFVQCNLLFGQYYCEVYQYSGADSLNKQQVRVLAYTNGVVRTETFIKFRKSATGDIDKTNYHVYSNNNTLLEILTVYSNGETQKTVNTYSKQGQIIKQQYWAFENPVKNAGQGKVWNITHETFYKYDKEGKRIKSEMPNLQANEQNHYVSTYGDDDKLTENKAYRQNNLVWVEKYTYSPSSYIVNRTEYDNEGKPKPAVKITYTLDEKGRTIERTSENAEGKITERTTTEYYNGPIDFFKNRNDIAKTVSYDENNKPKLTYIYIYRI